MRYRVKHITQYKYADRVSHCYNLANVVPRDTARQKCLDVQIHVSPRPVVTNQRSDYFGNQAFHFEIQKPHKELVISASSEIEIQESTPEQDLDLGMSYNEALAQIDQAATMDIIEAREFLLNSPMVKSSNELAEYAKPSFSTERPLNICVAELTSRIHEDFIYDPEFTTVATPLSDVMKHKRGVCQDFAHFQVGCLRAMGIPAKYVSGYIETLPPPGQEKLVGADATHAWVSYFSPEMGWVEFDPTNDSTAGNQHIVTAEGRDYFDVTPVRGVIFGGGKEPLLNVSVDVSRLG